MLPPFLKAPATRVTLGSPAHSNSGASRRDFLRQLAATAALGPLSAALSRAADTVSDENLPPVRAITRGPRFHWFGYYDKLQFSPDDRFVLANEVDFEGRSPRADDTIHVGMVDLEDGDKWIELGTTRAWNWQQGCMLQWLPGSKEEVIWNDREGDRFVARICNVRTRKIRTLANPIYTISPDGRTAIAPDFRRLNDCRPGYGYAGLPDPFADNLAPTETGIWKIDLSTGKQELLFNFAAARALPYAGKEEWAFKPGAKHWFNHLLFNTDGTRFFFLHRWRNAGDSLSKFRTRAYTCDGEGKHWHCMDPHGQTSHFIWRDPRHVMAWAWHPSHEFRFYLYEDQTENVSVVGDGDMMMNGHNTYLPGKHNEWVLNDTYPDAKRYQHPYLYHIPSRQNVPLGHFFTAPPYTGEWRCDNHPRASRNGKFVCIDSPHKDGRQMYLIDLRGLKLT